MNESERELASVSVAGQYQVEAELASVTSLTRALSGGDLTPLRPWDTAGDSRGEFGHQRPS